MSKKPSTALNNPIVPGFRHTQTAADIHEYVLTKNGLRVLYYARPGTSVITTNILYFVGAKDEMPGETGLAHMLEHMLFKPTTFDIAAGIDSAAMQFERETGCLLNATTWKERTHYYFSYPAQNFERALRIEAERMQGVVLTDESLKPERDNVLSEHDMNDADPMTALAVAMVSAAFFNHPYGHETIGYREDIEDFTAAKLETFYRTFYRPDNAVLMILGDIELQTALTKIKRHFGKLTNPPLPLVRRHAREPKQEGIRTVTVERPSEKNILSIGFKHAGFPSHDWFTTSALLDILAGNTESVLYKALVDTHKATSIEAFMEPTSDVNLGFITINAAPGVSLKELENKALSLLRTLSIETITPLLKKVKAQMLTSDAFKRDSSLGMAQELTEYAAAGDWTQYTKTPSVLEKITPKHVLQMTWKVFVPNNLTIGYFIGKK